MPNRSTADIAETIAITTLRNELGDGGIVTKIRDDISTAAEISTLARTIRVAEEYLKFFGEEPTPMMLGFR